MTREEILEKAKEQVTGQRITDYGKPEDSFGLIANFWSDYLDIDISSKDVCVMMALLKIARIKGNRATNDSFVDLAGYAACGGECWNNGRVSENIGDRNDELLTNTDPLKKKILEKSIKIEEVDDIYKNINPEVNDELVDQAIRKIPRYI